MPLAAISLVSAGVIGLEIVLLRLYAIAQWHHFAFMIISIALLGYGASGTVLALARRWLLPRFLAAWQVNAVVFGLTAMACPALAKEIPLNPLELAWDPSQVLHFGLTYLLLMVPFLCAANCVGLAFMHFGDRIGRVYRFDLVGASLGAAGVVAVLFVLPPGDCLRVLAALGFAAAAAAAFGKPSRAIGLAAGGVIVALMVPGSWVEPRPSEYKGLSLALRVPNTEVVLEHSSPLGLLSVVRSPAIPFRHAPGLSLSSTTEPPEQLGVFTDGDAMTAITRDVGDAGALAYLDETTGAAAYHLLERPEVLVLGSGGGAGVLLAKLHDASRIDAAELNPALVDLVRNTYADYAGRVYDPKSVTVRVADARAAVAASTRRYDLIHLPIRAGDGGVLSETYVYTAEAFADYLAHLRPGGLISITRPLRLPPRDALKLFATAIEALRRAGIANPDRHLALIRGWSTTTLLIKHDAFTAQEVTALRAFAKARSFDLAYLPGLQRAEANQYNILAEPYLFDGATALLGPEREAFIGRYKFDIRPARDDRPYFFDFFTWRALPELLGLRYAGGMPLIEWGILVLFATLIQAGVLSAVLILLPLLVWRRRGVEQRGRPKVVAYFLALGLAFLFVEIAFIQRLVLFLGHPLYAVALVLAAFLLFAGLGAGLSARLADRLRHARFNAIEVAVAGIAVIALAYLFALPPVLAWLMPLPAPAKIAAALAIIAPLAFWMGMPFPLGLAEVSARAPGLVPWAWGINGCASVISAVLATVLAMSIGFTAVVGLAVSLYVIAALVWRTRF